MAHVTIKAAPNVSKALNLTPLPLETLWGGTNYLELVIERDSGTLKGFQELFTSEALDF